MLQPQAAGPFNPFPVFKSNRRGNHHNAELLRKSSMLFYIQLAHLNFRMPVRNGVQRRLLHAARLEFAADAKDTEGLGYLAGRSFEAALTKRFSEILGKLK